METFFIVLCMLTSYVFGVVSGVIMMRKTTRSHEQWRDEMIQAQQLAKTRRNKVSNKEDEAWKPKIIDKKVDVSKAPFSKGNLSWKESVYKQA